jgi:type II restriction/modification system DNA methylase subunit YeeA
LTITDVTEKAARQFADLSESIHKHHPELETRQVARFLMKMMFCLFCEDVGLLPKNLFARIVEKTKDSRGKFTRSLRDLFQAMATGGDMWGEDIPYFNGGLFYRNDAEQDVIELDGNDARAVLRAAGDNWADVDPTIFGSLFQRALDIEGRRAELGAHYTSRVDIETIVEPVLMRPLRAEWAAIKQSALKLATGGKAPTAIRKLIAPFLDRLAALRVLDPACGSGNFLYVSLSLLKDLEQEVIAFAANLGLTEFEPRVSPAQLYGLEKDDFAHELASIVVWIGFLQWKLKNGYDPAGETPILKPLNNIQCMDAILSLTASTLTPALSLKGRGSHPSPFKGEGPGMRVITEPTWPACDVIVGNPPFLGDKKMRAELGDDYVEALRKLYGDRIPGQSDLCCYWFEKARAMIAEGNLKRAGLLATNSIRNGANQTVLERIKQTGDIFWAWSDREWIPKDRASDTAAVNVSMIGFDNGTEKWRELDGQVVNSINSDLSSSVNVTQAIPLGENSGICFLGMMKAGPFDIDSSIAQYMLSVVGNPNQRPNSDVIKRRLGGQDVTGRWRDGWVIDFGVMTEVEAASYERPFEYVKKHVKPLRDTNRRESMKRRWWMFGETRPGLRKAIKDLTRCIVTPEVAKHRLFVWMDTSVVPDHKLHVFARDDDYFFGVLHSRIHEIWSLKIGSTLEDRPSYSSSRTFETFPFPWPPGQEPSRGEAFAKDNQSISASASGSKSNRSDHGANASPLQRELAIAQAAKELVELRDRWLNPHKDQPAGIDVTLKKHTLTNLYNENPTWLQNAHRKLDEAVFAAYGWPSNLNDDEILARLLELNLQRAGK